MKKRQFAFIIVFIISLPSYCQEDFIDIPVLLEFRLEIIDSKIDQDLKRYLNIVGVKINYYAKQLNKENKEQKYTNLIDSYILYAREYIKKRPDSYTIERTMENMVEIITDDKEFFKLIEIINKEFPPTKY